MTTNIDQPESKSIFTSKTFYLGLLSPLIGWAVAKIGFNLPPDVVSAVTEALATASVAFVTNRFFTSQPVHVVTPQ